MLAADAAIVAANDIPALAPDELQPIIREAIARWTAAGLGDSGIARLEQAQFVIGDLPGSYLGEADAKVIRIDRDAAGYGWFVDPRPADDAEFADLVGNRAVANRVDLLTAVMHEMGHVLGYADVDADGLMSAKLSPGIRQASVTDQVFALLGEKTRQ